MAAQAAAIMAKNNIPTVDLYKAITTKCGAVPQAECFGSKGCFCPHCPANGTQHKQTDPLHSSLSLRSISTQAMLPLLFKFLTLFLRVAFDYRGRRLQLAHKLHDRAGNHQAALSDL